MKNALNSPTNNLDTNSGAARRWRLEAHDKVTIDREVDYVPVSDDESGHVLRRVDNPTLCESFTHEEFEAMRKEGRLSISRGFYLATQAKIRLPEHGTRITDLSTDDQVKVLWQKSICDQFLHMEAERTASRSDESMKAAIKKIVAELLAARFASGRCGSADVTVKRPPSPRTLRRWLRRYETCGYNAMALVDGYHRCGDRRRGRPRPRGLTNASKWRFRSNVGRETIRGRGATAGASRYIAAWMQLSVANRF